MKASLDSAKLLAALKRASLAAERDGICGHVLLIAEGDLSVQTTDMVISYKEHLDAKIESGRTVVNAALLSKALRGGPVSLALDDHTLAIQSGDAVAHLQTLGPDAFPESLGFSKDYPCQFVMDIEVFAQALNWCLPSLEPEDSVRHHLTGVELRYGIDLLFTGSDGKILTRRSLPAPLGANNLPENEAGAQSIIIPKKFCRLVDQLEGDGLFKISDSVISVEAGKRLIISRLLDGSYPDVSKMLPDRSANKIVFGPELTSAIEYIKGLGSGRVSINAAGKTATVEGAASQVTVPCEGHGKIGFDIAHLSRACKASDRLIFFVGEHSCYLGEADTVLCSMLPERVAAAA